MLETHAALEIFEEIDSTSLEARRRAERGEYGPVWLMARAQSAGRGRRGRAWSSLPGNLMATYLGRTARPPGEIALLGFAAGVALAEAAEEWIGPGRAALKWPNDLMLDGAKAAGLLIDSGSAPGGHWFALGLGLNILDAPEGLDQETAALARALAPGAQAPSPEAMLKRVRARLEARADALTREGFAPLRQAWLARAYGLGQTARVTLGSENVEGRLVGLSPQGELELETRTGLRLIAAGDVLFAPTTA
ncbi:MAG: biotin--[acetyl-CoA-carboxylase] ligase [Hyphomonadaceae bacterium]